MHWAMDTDADAMYIVPTRLSTSDDPFLASMDSKHTSQAFTASLFFICWIILGCFVVVNMTIGVVVDTFSQIKAENDGLLLMSEDAADWVKAQKQVLAQRPLKQADPPAAAWRKPFYDLVTSTQFEIATMSIIVLNMVQMGVNWFEPAANAPYMKDLKAVMGILDIIFLTLYTIEMFLKFTGLGVIQYHFTSGKLCVGKIDKSNVFDSVLVYAGWLDFALSQLDAGEMPFPPTILRILRIFRILRLVRTAKSLRTIMMTVYISIPQLYNISTLIMLIVLITDMLCVNIFSNVNYTPGNFDFTADHAESASRGEVYDADDYHWSASKTNWGDSINRHANFQFFWTGLLVLARSTTGESFNAIMHDTFSWDWGHNRLTCCKQCGPMIDMTRDANGRLEPQDSCGSIGFALPIYLLFQLIMAYVVLSIMIGVILENFANAGSVTRKITMEQIEDFRLVWLKYDPKGTFVVPSHNLLAILQQLPHPLGIKNAQPALTRADMLRHVGSLEIPDHGGYIHFMETLTAVSHNHAGCPVPVCDTTQKLKKAAAKVPQLRQLKEPAHDALTNYLVSLLQSRWRGYAMRRKGDEAADAPPPAYDGGKVKANQVAPGP